MFFKCFFFLGVQFLFSYWQYKLAFLLHYDFLCYWPKLLMKMCIPTKKKDLQVNRSKYTSPHYSCYMSKLNFLFLFLWQLCNKFTNDATEKVFRFLNSTNIWLITFNIPQQFNTSLNSTKLQCKFYKLLQYAINKSKNSCNMQWISPKTLAICNK